ncbi:uncharacterized protein J7T54_002743 [Emericellopsis cladophorae]|uniref:GTP cyclohydrolase 1 n=1 Tax=Emericellopsis cladophorae TaxID=2686198 RepID=A0A9P9XU29_9HYPO|nr:uncharacterized protein J7T54_002743 [Emericellopsis cladophorae]KAI6777822.1 hypothetical protein J7T54_002743 [Emericellopsis cladophorae]
MGQSDASEPREQPLLTDSIVGSSFTRTSYTRNRNRKEGKRRRILNKNARQSRVKPTTGKTNLLPSQKSSSPIVDFNDIGRSSSATHGRANETPKQAKERLEKMCGAVRTLLECVGEDPNREGLLATPSRYAKALLYLTKGYQDNVKNVVNDAFFCESHKGMVIVKDIEIYSLCEHHLVPFTGKMHIGYVPSDTVIGLSKLPRIAEMFSRRLQVQERLTQDVAQAVMDILNPQGVAVIMDSAHLCMVMRGVEKTCTTTITSCVLGCFKKDSTVRNEFLSLVNFNRT